MIQAPGVNVTKTEGQNQLLISGKYFQASLMFLTKAGASLRVASTSKMLE
jgi:hypothetical protein